MHIAQPNIWCNIVRGATLLDLRVGTFPEEEDLGT